MTIIMVINRIKSLQKWYSSIKVMETRVKPGRTKIIVEILAGFNYIPEVNLLLVVNFFFVL